MLFDVRYGPSHSFVRITAYLTVTEPTYYCADKHKDRGRNEPYGRGLGRTDTSKNAR